ncbi:type II secretion system protein E [Acidothermus cellulolyticus 11B]|uniref:Type II secretion system protein E n=2 Tax=Acidothermus cellulolyticus TaxID=28049 RepID=A0LVY5_ACIC1|nr:type II secretion system protein E [Acidothermus cellulolyticus 11B]
MTAPEVDADVRYGGAAGERPRIGHVLVSSGLLSNRELAAILDAQRDGPRRRLGQIALDLGYVDEEQLADVLAEFFGLPTIDLATAELDVALARQVPRRVAERTQTLVVRQLRPGVLLVATADPGDVVALDDIRAYTGATVLQLAVTTPTAILRRIRDIWGVLEETTSLDAVVEPERTEDPVAEARIDDTPIVRLATGLLVEAVHSAASDIHVEPQPDGLRVRYRVDGMLRDVARVPRTSSAALISRLKISAGLDIAERRLPQDGRLRFHADGVAVDARVSTLPGIHGEKLVIRLLPTGEVAELDSLGLDADQLAVLRSAAHAPQGLIVFTGPTGSGKTHTLYSLLREISVPERNVVTLEDPVEIQFPGITQVQINERTGLDFARGLRAILRQDPDVILVGEIRDTETAELAVRAALTGHLVLTTLHTLDAAAAVTRLVDMGVAPFLVASSLTAVIAQRLVRRPCPRCVEDAAPDSGMLAALGDHDWSGARFVAGVGCHHCGGTGYQGRTGIFEVLAVDAMVRAVLRRSGDEETIRATAIEAGMTTLRAAALRAVRTGVTTVEEVLRVCPPA